MKTISRRSMLLVAIGLTVAATTAANAEEAEQGELVAFNTKTRKYHCPECEWAIKCTRNCVLASREAAQARGGIPCKVCGGGCSGTTIIEGDAATVLHCPAEAPIAARRTSWRARFR